MTDSREIAREAALSILEMVQPQRVGTVDRFETIIKSALDKAVLEEREACAVCCDEIEQRYWARYKGRDGKPGSLSPNDEGRSDGANECSAAIRARGET
jgi:hypothetical protein